MVSRQTGIIITAVMAVLFGCAGLFNFGLAVLGTSGLFRGLRSAEGGLLSRPVLEWGATTCAALAFISMPVISYVVLVANNKPSARPEPPAGPAG